MRGWKTFLLLVVVVVAGVAVALVHAVNLTAGLSFVAGFALGAISLGSVALGAYGYAREGSSVWRVLGALWRWGHLAVVAGLLWLLITRWQAEGMWLAVGYTVALAVFVAVMAGGGKRRGLVKSE